MVTLYHRKQCGGDDYDIDNKERSGQPEKFDDEQFETLLKENPAQTLKEFAEQLEVDKLKISHHSYTHNGQD